MIITYKALKSINSNTSAKTRLASELSISIHTVERWIKDNKSNGGLTKTRAVQIIAEETGLSNQEVLEENNVPTING